MKKILIVDDEPNIVMSLEYIFKKEDFEVFIARDGAEAIEIFENNKIDIIILDIMMPNVDGYQVLKHLKNSPKLKDIKVLFFSDGDFDITEQNMFRFLEKLLKN